MKEIYLIRHGETAWNGPEIFRGRSDIPLTERGLTQARLAGKALSKVSLATIYSGPLQRARCTAEEIARPQALPVVVEEGLNDMCLGQWEGRTIEEVQNKYPREYKLWKETPQRLDIPGGERLEVVRRRAVRAMKTILSDMEEQSAAAVVSHRVVTKLLILAILGLGNDHFWKVQQDLACINRFIFPYDFSSGILAGLNNTAHLQS